MRVNFKLKGIRQVARNLNLVEEDLMEAVGEGMMKIAKNIMAEADKQVPEMTGALRSSGFIEGPVYGIDQVTILFGYGTMDVVNPKTGQPTYEYAGYVHEIMWYNHPKGKAKFLEDPVNEALPTLLEDLAAEVAKALFRKTK